MPSIQDIRLCGTYGELFAQIQGDSVIAGRFLEGNFIPNIIAAGDILLTDLQANPLLEYIDHAEYNQHRGEFVSNFTSPQYFEAHQNGVMVAQLCDLLKKENFAVFSFSISKHSIIIELEIKGDFFNISVYNTGFGLDYHLAQAKDGIVRKQACKRHKINLANTNKETNIQEILTLLFGQETSSLNKNDDPKKLVGNIQILYFMMESLVTDYSGSEIDGNNSTFIKGQISGTCVWKSYLRYMREKLMQKVPNTDFDLLLKYDIKIRSLLNIIEITTNPRKIIISKELIYTLEFASENNLRLAQKLYSKNLITEKNLQSAINLSNKILSLKTDISQYTIPEQPYEIDTDLFYSQKPEPIKSDQEDTLQASINIEEYYQTNFPINSKENCIKTIEEFTKPENNIIDNHTALISAMDYLCPSLTNIFVSQENKISTEQATQILNNLLKLSFKYYDYSLKDINTGYSERRKINMLFIGILCLDYTRIILGDPQEYSEDTGDILAIFSHTLHEFSRNSVIDDPTTNIINQQFMLQITGFIKELFNKKSRILWSQEEIYITPEVDNALKEIYHKTKAQGLGLFLTICKTIYQIVRFSWIWTDGNNNEFMHTLIIDHVIRHDYQPYRLPCPTEHEIIFAINNGHKLHIYDLKRLELKKNPVDRYILNEESDVCRWGMINFSELEKINSDTAYIPKGAKITREDADNSQLQSMFVEDSISLLRLSEFLKEIHAKLNMKKYIHIIYLRLFYNNAIRRNLIYAPENVLTFLKTITSDEVINLDLKPNINNRAIFILQLYYMSAWNILTFINDCNNPDLRKKIFLEIKNTDLHSYLDSKISTINRNNNNQHQTELTTLLSLKALSYKLKFQTNQQLSKEELLDLIKTNIRLSTITNQSSTLLNVVPLTVKEVLNTDNHNFNEIKAELAKFIATHVGYAENKIVNIEYLTSQKQVNITFDNLTCNFDLINCTAVLGENHLTKIPKHFTQNTTFQKCFSQELKLCYTLNQNHIKFNFKNREFEVIKTR
jgi:hypothetical protein